MPDDVNTPPAEDTEPEPEATTTPAPEPGPRLPPWAPWAAAGVLALAVIGLAVGLFVRGGGGSSSGGSSDDARTAETIRQMVLLFGQQSGQLVNARSSIGKLSDGMPSDIPSYPGARLVSSNTVESSGQAPYFFVVFDTGDSQKNVIDYFARALDSDPWKLVGESRRQESVVFQFQRGDDPTQSGVVVVGQPEGEFTSIMMIFSDEQAQSTPPAFKPGPNQDLPAGFPGDVPIYPGATVAETAFSATSGPAQYRIGLLTKDSDSKVLDSYRSKLGDAGYQVTDSGSGSSSGTPSADATPSADTTPTAIDISSSSYNGTISTGPATEDPTYTQVVIQLQATGQ